MLSIPIKSWAFSTCTGFTWLSFRSESTVSRCPKSPEGWKVATWLNGYNEYNTRNSFIGSLGNSHGQDSITRWSRWWRLFFEIAVCGHGGQSRFPPYQMQWFVVRKIPQQNQKIVPFCCSLGPNGDAPAGSSEQGWLKETAYFQSTPINNFSNVCWSNTDDKRSLMKLSSRIGSCGLNYAHSRAVTFLRRGSWIRNVAAAVAGEQIKCWWQSYHKQNLAFCFIWTFQFCLKQLFPMVGKQKENTSRHQLASSQPSTSISRGFSGYYLQKIPKSLCLSQAHEKQA